LNKDTKSQVSANKGVKTLKVVVQEEVTGCGIASVANIVGKTYAEMKQIANAMGIYATDEVLWSETHHVRRMLAAEGVATSNEELPFESWAALPDIALLAIKHHQEKGRDFWHWVVFKRLQGREYVLDSASYLPTNLRTDFEAMQPKWFIPVWKKQALSELSQPVLETERLILRPFSLDDAARVQHLAGNEQVAKMVANIPHPYPDQAASQWILGHGTGWNDGSLVAYAVLEKVSMLLVGAISLLIDKAKSEGELGYWLGVEYWGRGLMSEAGQRLLDFGFDTLALQRVHARCLSQNAASGKVLQKLGLQHISRSHGLCGDKEAEIDCYELRQGGLS